LNVKNILVLTSWAYNEGLIQSSTLPYLRMLHAISPDSKIFLVTQEKQALDQQDIDSAIRGLGPVNGVLIAQTYQRMGIKKIIVSALQFFRLWWLVISKNISHIHCFCTPAGSTGYLLSVLTGKKLVLDSFEPHAEAMLENQTWTRKSLGFRILSWFEKKQAQRAEYCLNAATGMDDYAKKKYNVTLRNFTVKPCCVDMELFQYDEKASFQLRGQLNWQDKIVCVYAGKFGGIYLDKEVFDFFSQAYQYWGEKFRVLLLSSITPDELSRFCKDSKLPPHIIHARAIPFSQMPRYLSMADFGITPVKPVPSKRYCSPIKDGEYWAMGLPVVITKDISDDSQIIEQNNIGAVLYRLDDESYRVAINKIDGLLKEDRRMLREKTRSVAERYRNYSIAEKAYRRIYKDEKPS
jgi:glycosyltransferase involved in cell wall biosynthesis